MYEEQDEKIKLLIEMLLFIKRLICYYKLQNLMTQFLFCHTSLLICCN